MRAPCGHTISSPKSKDPDVCKYHLVGDCPHEMWVNQGGKASPNSPVGPCKKQHSEAAICQHIVGMWPGYLEMINQ